MIKDNIFLFVIVCLVSAFVAISIGEIVDRRLDEQSTRRVFELREVKK